MWYTMAYIPQRKLVPISGMYIDYIIIIILQY